MARGVSPQEALDNIPPQAVSEMVGSLMELHSAGKPETDREVEERIDKYFLFCQHSSIRPGIESLCLALHISRTTLFNWANGNGCSKERQELIQTAKGFISAFIEQCLLSGRINPASGIFIAKNWLGYKDSISIEESIPETRDRPQMTIADIQSRVLELSNRQNMSE